MAVPRRRSARAAAALACIAAMFAPAAQPFAAEDVGWYMGLSVGQSRFAVDERGLRSLTSSPDTTHGNDSKGYGLFVGYRFDARLAVEASRVQLGSIPFQTGWRIPVCPPGLFCIAVVYPPAGGTLEASLWHIGGTAALPLAPRFSLVGRVKLVFSEVSIRVPSLDLSGPPTALVETTTRRVRPALGAGMAYRLSERASARLDWDRYRGLDKNGRSGLDRIDFASLSLEYRF